MLQWEQVPTIILQHNLVDKTSLFHKAIKLQGRAQSKKCGRFSRDLVGAEPAPAPELVNFCLIWSQNGSFPIIQTYLVVFLVQENMQRLLNVKPFEEKFYLLGRPTLPTTRSACCAWFLFHLRRKRQTTRDGSWTVAKITFSSQKVTFIFRH